MDFTNMKFSKIKSVMLEFDKMDENGFTGEKHFHEVREDSDISDLPEYEKEVVKLARKAADDAKAKEVTVEPVEEILK